MKAFPLPIRSLLVWVIALLGLAAALSPATGHAHQGNPDYRSVINELQPPVEGIELEVIDYDADIRLTAPPETRIDIPGYDGEPYARILPDGTVQVNQRSRAAYLNTERYGNASVPDTVDAEAPPEWETVRNDGIFQWHDHRSHWMSPEPPERLQGVNERTKVFDYEIPIEVDGEPVMIAGTLFWVGSESGSKLPFIIAGIVIILGGVAAVLVARRRREAGDPGDETPGEDSGGW